MGAVQHAPSRRRGIPRRVSASVFAADRASRPMSRPFHDHFSEIAQRYANFRPRYPAALFDWLATLVQEFYFNTVGPHWPPGRKLVEEGYRTISFPFVEIAPPTFRMEVRWTLDQLLGYFSTWSSTNRYHKATGRDPLEPLSAELSRV